jgi:hypothetical protein
MTREYFECLLAVFFFAFYRARALGTKARSFVSTTALSFSSKGRLGRAERGAKMEILKRNIYFERRKDTF